MSDDHLRDQPGDEPSSVAVRRTRASVADSDDEQPVGRALMSRSADSRDWADTGDPDYEPALEGDSVGDHDDAPQVGGSGSGSGDASRDEDTVMLTRPVLPARPAGVATGVEAEASARERLAAQVAENVELAATLAEREEAAASESAPEPQPPSPSQPEPASQPAPASSPQVAPPDEAKRVRGRLPRLPMLLQGLLPALLAAALAGAASLGALPLAVGVLAVQVFLLLGALALLDAPAAGGAFLVAIGAVVAADVVVLVDDGSVSRLAGVAGLGFVAALAHQLARRSRSRVTESLADTLVVLVVGVSAACLLALSEVEGGRQVLLVSLAAAGAVLLAGRIGDALAPRPMLAVGSTRGWPGLLLGLGAGVAAAGLVADLAGEPPLRSAVLLGLVVASTVATADLAVDLGAAELRAGWRDARRVAALRPTALLLPYAVLGPVALLAGRLLLN